MYYLLIIGNGFDIAHGLKTSYENFLSDLRNKLQKDPSDFDDIVYTKKNKDSTVLQQRILPHGTSQYKNKLLHFFYSFSLNYNWSDVEYNYFKILQNFDNKEFFKKTYKSDFNYNNAKELNDDFKQVKKYLEKYLIQEQTKFRKIDSVEHLFSILNNDDTLILNFNYSNTVKEYIKKYSKIKLIHIHGELNNPDNPIIFGFAANDMDTKNLIDRDDNELMRNIKRINYKLTNNELLLNEAMENSERIEVIICGHSCGVSDRLILNQIFNHNKVNSIKPFYYNCKEAYIELAININRIMDDYSKENTQERLFKRLHNYPNCHPMIQYNSSPDEIDKFKSYIENVTIERTNYYKNREAIYGALMR